MLKFLSRLFEPKKKKNEVRDFEMEKFQRLAREQFKRLREKGLSIPVVTL